MDENTTAQQILERIKRLEEMLRMALLEKKLEDLEKRISTLGAGSAAGPEKSEKFINELNSKLEEKSEPLSEALDYLVDITTVQRDEDGRRTYLLHRPTPNLEHERSTDDGSNIYITDVNTDWVAEIEAAESQQMAKNPVVSIWVNEEDIVKIEGAEENTGTWKDLGANPHATKFRIWIKPGKYQIYRELNQ